jgi:hypothetical protein
MSSLGGNVFVLTSADVATALPVPANADLVAVYVNLGTAGSTASTVQVNKNGASAGASALATVAASATKASLGIVNPYVGVNAAAGAWTDQSGTQYPGSAGGVNNVSPLASYSAGDTISLTTALGTSAANPNVSLVFAAR